MLPTVKYIHFLTSKLKYDRNVFDMYIYNGAIAMELSGNLRDCV